MNDDNGYVIALQWILLGKKVYTQIPINLIFTFLEGKRLYVCDAGEKNGIGISRKGIQLKF